jgi:type III restriction enzyme
MRASVLFHLTRHLLTSKYRDPGEEPNFHLFGQLKRITRRWLAGGYLKCSGGTYLAQLCYRGLADIAAERIKAAMTESLSGEKPVKRSSTPTIQPARPRPARKCSPESPRP